MSTRLYITVQDQQGATALKLGLLGFGEVGTVFAAGIKEQGQTAEVFAYDQNLDHDWQGKLIRTRAIETGANLVGSLAELLEETDLVLSVVPASAVLSIARSIAGMSIAKKLLLCDLSSATPNVKQEAAKILDKNHVSYIDGAIMGSMITYGFSAPIYLAASDAKAVQDKLQSVGFNVKVIGSEVGMASAVKMLRSSFTKGFEALLLETFYAAFLFKAEEAVLETLSDTFDQEKFSDTVNRYITSSAIHAERRLKEISSVADFLKQIGIEPFMVRGSRERLAWMADMDLREKFQGIAPADFRQVLQTLLELKTV